MSEIETTIRARDNYDHTYTILRLARDLGAITGEQARKARENDEHLSLEVGDRPAELLGYTYDRKADLYTFEDYAIDGQELNNLVRSPYVAIGRLLRELDDCRKALTAARAEANIHIEGDVGEIRKALRKAL